MRAAVCGAVLAGLLCCCVAALPSSAATQQDSEGLLLARQASLLEAEALKTGDGDLRFSLRRQSASLYARALRAMPDDRELWKRYALLIEAVAEDSVTNQRRLQLLDRRMYLRKGHTLHEGDEDWRVAACPDSGRLWQAWDAGAPESLEEDELRQAQHCLHGRAVRIPDSDTRRPFLRQSLDIALYRSRFAARQAPADDSEPEPYERYERIRVAPPMDAAWILFDWARLENADTDNGRQVLRDLAQESRSAARDLSGEGPWTVLAEAVSVFSEARASKSGAWPRAAEALYQAASSLLEPYLLADPYAFDHVYMLWETVDASYARALTAGETRSLWSARLAAHRTLSDALRRARFDEPVRITYPLYGMLDACDALEGLDSRDAEAFRQRGDALRALARSFYGYEQHRLRQAALEAYERSLALAPGLKATLAQDMEAVRKGLEDENGDPDPYSPSSEYDGEYENEDEAEGETDNTMAGRRAIASYHPVMSRVSTSPSFTAAVYDPDHPLPLLRTASPDSGPDALRAEVFRLQRGLPSNGGSNGDGVEQWVRALGRLLAVSPEPVGDLQACMDALTGSVNLAYHHYVWNRWQSSLDELAGSLAGKPDLLFALRAKAADISGRYAAVSPYSNTDVVIDHGDNLRKLALATRDPDERLKTFQRAAGILEQALNADSPSYDWHALAARLYGDRDPVFSDFTQRDRIRKAFLRAMRERLWKPDTTRSVNWLIYGNTLLHLSEALYDRAEKNDLHAEALAVYPAISALRPDDPAIFTTWGSALSRSIKLFTDEGILVQAAEQVAQCFARAAELEPESRDIAGALAVSRATWALLLPADAAGNAAILAAHNDFKRLMHLLSLDLGEISYRAEYNGYGSGHPALETSAELWRSLLWNMAERHADDPAEYKHWLEEAVAALDHCLYPVRYPSLMTERGLACARLAEVEADPARKRAAYEQALQAFTWTMRRTSHTEEGELHLAAGDALTSLGRDAAGSGTGKKAESMLSHAARLYEYAIRGHSWRIPACRAWHDLFIKEDPAIPQAWREREREASLSRLAAWASWNDLMTEGEWQDFKTAILDGDLPEGD